MDDFKYIELAIFLSKKAFFLDEVPVGAVIVNEKGSVIGKGFNCKHKKNSIFEHAEIVAIKRATKKINNWRLNNCTLYTTLFPCVLCSAAIQQSRIKKIVYIYNSSDIESVKIAKNILNNKNLQHKVVIEHFISSNQENLLKIFFEDKRNK